jgi:hypothetical protein
MPQEKVTACKCCSCGRFIGYDEMGEGGTASFYFEPDSDRGREISEWTCGACVARLNLHGDSRDGGSK